MSCRRKGNATRLTRITFGLGLVPLVGLASVHQALDSGRAALRATFDMSARAYDLPDANNQRATLAQQHNSRLTTRHDLVAQSGTASADNGDPHSVVPPPPPPPAAPAEGTESNAQPQLPSSEKETVAPNKIPTWIEQRFDTPRVGQVRLELEALAGRRFRCCRCCQQVLSKFRICKDERLPRR